MLLYSNPSYRNVHIKKIFFFTWITPWKEICKSQRLPCKNIWTIKYNKVQRQKTLRVGNWFTSMHNNTPSSQIENTNKLGCFQTFYLHAHFTSSPQLTKYSFIWKSNLQTHKIYAIFCTTTTNCLLSYIPIFSATCAVSFTPARYMYNASVRRN